MNLFNAIHETDLILAVVLFFVSFRLEFHCSPLMSDNIHVACRVRPQNAIERKNNGHEWYR